MPSQAHLLPVESYQARCSADVTRRLRRLIRVGVAIDQGVRFIAEGIVDHPHRFQVPYDHEMQAPPCLTRKRPEGVLPGRLRETRAFGRETWPGVPKSSPQLQSSPS